MLFVFLGVAVRYVDTTHNVTKSAFLELKTIERGTGEAMADAVEEVLAKFNLDISTFSSFYIFYDLACNVMKFFLM